MIENLFWLSAGLVLGVVYHAKLQPYVDRAVARFNDWRKFKA